MDGCWVGWPEGACDKDGCTDGSLVGDADGDELGFVDGDADGALDGAADGNELGFSDGAVEIEGDVEGWKSNIVVSVP